MAMVSGLTSTDTQIFWYVDGLDRPVNQYSNIRVEVWLGATIVTNESFTLSATDKSFIYTSSGLSSSKAYTVKVWTRYAANPVVYIGSAVYSTQSAGGSSPVRPSNWTWPRSYTSGQNINITAADWNGFCDRIDDFRRYKGLVNGAYTTAYTGLPITAAQYNQARLAISDMGATAFVAYAGVDTNPAKFDEIKNALNAIT